MIMRCANGMSQEAMCSRELRTWLVLYYATTTTTTNNNNSNNNNHTQHPQLILQHHHPPIISWLKIDYKYHTMDMLWEKFQWILPLYMKLIRFYLKASVVCSVTTAVFLDFCPKKLNVFSQHIGKITNENLSSAEKKITRNWNVNLVSVLITSWDIT